MKFLLAIFAVLTLSLSIAAQAPPAPKAPELPPNWVEFDAAKSTDAKVWHAPSSRGEFFFQDKIVANEAGETDPFWFSRKSTQEWPGNEVWRVGVFADPEKAGRKIDLIRQTSEAFPKMHDGDGRPWNFVHSPVRLESEDFALRFRRVADKTKAGGWDVFSEFAPTSRASRVAKFRLEGLAEAPKVFADQILIRSFPDDIEESHLVLLQLAASEAKPAALKQIADYAPDGFPILSRPLWLGENVFVCLRAQKDSMEMREIAGEPRQTAYQGELVRVELESTTTKGEEGPTTHSFEFKTTVLRKDFVMPVESVVTPMQVFSKGDKRLLCVIEEKGEQRRIASFAFGGPKLALLPTEASVAPWVNGLKGIWKAAESSEFFGKLTPTLLIGETIVALDPQGKRYIHPKEAQTLKGVSSVLDAGGNIILFSQSEGLPSPAIDYQVSEPRMAASDTVSIWHRRYTSAQVAQAIVPRTWISENVEAAKRFDRVFAAGGLKYLNNMLLIYEANILVDSAEIENKKGTMVELWTRRSQRDPEALRTEDNLGTTWQIRALSGGKLYIGSDARKTLTFNDNLPKDRLEQQLRVRQLLMLNGCGEANEGGMRYLQTLDYVLPKEDGTAGKSTRYHLFSRQLKDGTGALYFFPVDGNDHNPAAVSLEFQLGDEKSRRSVMLLLSGYQDLVDLQGNGEALLVPAQIRAIDPQSQETKFTLSLKASLARATASKPLKSGYNMAGITADDFTKNYQID